MQYLICAFTDKGNFREKNEDTVFAADMILTSGSHQTRMEAPFLVSVCDGVGGEKAGDVASQTAARSLAEAIYATDELLREEILNIHKAIRERSDQDPDCENMQTTLCCLAVDPNGRLTCFNTGDSRLYLYKDGRVSQISKDHSYVRMLFELGEITEEELAGHPQKNIITSSIGTLSDEPVIDVIPVAEALGKNDAVILCSDGVSDHLGYMEIEAAMSLQTTFDEKLKALAELALERGSRDNVSVAGVMLSNSYKEQE